MGFHQTWDNRIIESLKLEKISEVSIPKPSPLMTTVSLSATSPSSGAPPGTVTPHLPGQPCHCSTALLEQFFLISNLSLPWHKWRPSPLVLLRYLGEQTEPHFTTVSCQRIVKTWKKIEWLQDWQRAQRKGAGVVSQWQRQAKEKDIPAL